MFRFFLLMMISISSQLPAQNYHEYLARVNYQNVGFAALDSFPGVTWVNDNGAYDQNAKRFFFEGNDYSLSPPWTLYTINAITGAISSQVPIPANLPQSDHVYCLQYDNSCDTLYGIYSNANSQFFSAWIEPLTGNVHLKCLLTGMSGYAAGVNTFDEIHHRMIFEGVINGTGMITVDARTGQLLGSCSSCFGILEYDNSTDHLYGIYPGISTAFDSIDALTGAQHLISYLPNESFYQNGISAIDEPNNRFIFCGHSAQNNHDSLFVLDLQTGNILSQQYYAYANSAIFTVQNLISFSFDQLSGELYALHWGDKDDNTSGINSLIENETLQIMPNPCSQEVMVNFNSTYENINVKIYNALGELVGNENDNEASSLKINTSNWPGGIYFFSVSADGQTKGVQKVVVQ